MDEDLKKILADEPETPALEDTETTKTPDSGEDPEVSARREQLANLERAIKEANDELRDTRKAAKEKKLEDDELPKIDLEDPSARAWDKRIRESVGPVASEIEKAKDERRTFALRQFLAERPALAKDTDKVKRMMATYDRIKDNTELTTEGIFLDLERAYAADNYIEIDLDNRQARIDRARQDNAFSRAGVSGGSTGYASERPSKKQYTEDELDIIRQWERGGAPKVD